LAERVTDLRQGFATFGAMLSEEAFLAVCSGTALPCPAKELGTFSPLVQNLPPWFGVMTCL